MHHDFWRALIKAFLFMAFIVFAMLLIWPAEAQVQCNTHARMTSVLANKYNESPRTSGTVGTQRIMQTFVSATGSWTVVITRIDGWACIVASGKDWEDVLFEPGQKS